jgi:hypothetical protein
MTTYLFTWNPAQWDWTYLQDSIAKVKEAGYCTEPWSCGVTKKIQLARLRIGQKEYNIA